MSAADPSPIRREHEYVLGTNDEELQRLGFQHRLWSAQATQLWEQAGFTLGQSILDVGSGPGFASIDLCAWVGSAGRVTAIDESPKFINHLRERRQALGLTNLDLVQCDAQKLHLEADRFDGAYARWVLCFVRDPLAVVRGVAHALKPGGAFAVQDYLNYTALTVAPPSEPIRKVIKAVDASWRAHGGDPDIMLRLPRMMVECGLRILSFKPFVRSGGPRSALWQWPNTFFRNYLPVLQGLNLITSDDRAAFEADWRERTELPHAQFTTPIVADLIAVKPSDH